MSKISLYVKGIGMMVGMIFGAGVFALPYVFSQAGVFWGSLHLVVALFFILVLHLFYADIAFYSEERMRLAGQIRKFLDARYEPLVMMVTLFASYGTLLAYGILGGVFFHNIFPSASIEILTFLFFFIVSVTSVSRLDKIALINFYLTVPIFIFIGYLLYASAPKIDVHNFFISAKEGFWFVPYGVWLFALSGFSVVSETRDLFYRASLSDFRRVIVLSILISLLFYIIFIVSVLGVAGPETSKDALSGLKTILGPGVVFGGSIIGFLAVFTSAISLNTNLKNLFRFDYKRNYLFSWLLAVLPAPILYFIGIQNFITIIQIVGAVSLGIFGVFIVLMRKNIAKTEFNEHLLIGESNVLSAILIIGLIIGVALEIYTTLS